MRIFKSRSIASYLLLSILFLTLTPPAWAQTAQEQVLQKHKATLTKVQGTVEIKVTGEKEWKAAAENMSLKTGEKIRTGKDGRAKVKIGDVGEVALTPGTEVAVGNLQQVQTTARAFLVFQRTVVRDDVELDLKNGDMRNSFHKQEGRVGKYNVFTPVAVAGVRGTIFELDLEGKKAWYESLEEGKGDGGNEGLTVTVGEGLVGVNGPNWEKEVGAGQELKATKGSVPGDPKDAPAHKLKELKGEFKDGTAPSFGGAKTADMTTGALRIEWDAATDNVTAQEKIVYDVYISNTSKGQDFSKPTATTDPGLTKYALDNLDVKKEYFVVVRARDAEGNRDANAKEVSTAATDKSAPAFEGAQTVELASDGKSMKVNWAAATDDITPKEKIVYDIYVAKSSKGQEFSTPSHTSAAGAVNMEITGLDEKEFYYVIVRARDLAGNRDENTKEVTTWKEDETLPTFDGVVSAREIASGLLEVTWGNGDDDRTDPSDLVYDIYVATTTGGQDFNTPTATSGAGVLSQMVSISQESLRYYIVVRTRDEAGNRDINVKELMITSPSYIEKTVTERTQALYDAYAAEDANSFMALVNSSFAGVNSGGLALTYGTLRESLETDFKNFESGNYSFNISSVVDAGNNTVVASVVWSARIRFSSDGSERTLTGLNTKMAWDVNYMPTTLISWEGQSAFGLASPTAAPGEAPTVPVSTTTTTTTTTTPTIPASGSVTSTVTIGSGQSLTIDPGSTVTFASGTGIEVQSGGTLTANSVTLSGSSWSGVTVQSGATINMTGSTISGATTGLTLVGGSGTISGNTFSNNNLAMSILSGSSHTISSNQITVASPGITISDASPTITGNTFTGSSSTDALLSVTGGSSPNITSNTFSGGGGVDLKASSGSVTFSSNSISSSVGDAIDLEGGASVSISGVTITSPSGIGIDMTASFTGTLSLSGSNTISAPTSFGLQAAGGTLSSSGATSIASPGGAYGVILTGSVSSATLDGFSVSGSSSNTGYGINSTASITLSNSSAVGCNYGLAMIQPGTVTGSNLNLTQNVSGAFSDGSSDGLKQGSVSISSGSLTKNSGTVVTVNGGTLTLTGVTVSGGSTSGIALSSGTLNLTGTSANTIQNNGTGLTVSGGTLSMSGTNSFASNTTGMSFSTSSASLSGLSLTGNTTGIDFAGGGSYDVSSSTITGSGGSSTGIKLTSGSLTISSVTLSSHNVGLDLTSGASSATLNSLTTSGATTGVKISAPVTVTFSGGSLNSGTTGLEIASGANVTVSNLSATGNTGNAVSLTNAASSATLTMSNSTLGGPLVVANGASGSSVNLSGGNTISSSGSYAVDIQDGGLTTNGSNTITGGSTAGMRLSGTTTGSITSLTVNGSSGDGILLSGTGSVTLTSVNSSSNSGGDGLEINGFSNVTITGSTFSSNGQKGVYVPSSGTVTVSSSNLQNNSSYGISRPNTLPPGSVSLSSCTLSGNRGQGTTDQTASTDGSGSGSTFVFTTAQYENLISPPNSVTNPL